jgi:hypothetical protein
MVVHKFAQGLPEKHDHVEHLAKDVDITFWVD